MSGRLILVPNTLDLGAGEVSLGDVLPDLVLSHAARLRHWVVEDARSARAFLKRVDAHHPLQHPLQQLSMHELPRPRKGSREVIAPAVWRDLLAPVREGDDVGLLSQAGLPAVADPGAALVQVAHQLGIPVLPLAGPSSLLLALAASGLNGQSFAFVGYLPQDASGRAARLRELELRSRKEQQSQLIIETPYRNAALLATMLEVLAAGTQLSISCGLTLPEGWTHSATVADWRQRRLVMPERLPAVFVLQADVTKP